MADEGLISVPAVTLSGTGTNATGIAAITIPSLTISGTGRSAGLMAVTVPSLTIAGVGYTGRVGIGEIDLPAVAIDAWGSDHVVRIPPPTIAATGIAGQIGVGAVEAPQETIAGICLTGTAGAAEINIPDPVVEGSFGIAGNITIPTLTIAAVGKTGQVGQASVTLPQVTVDGDEYNTSVISGGVVVPTLTLVATGISSSVINGAVTAPDVTISANGLTGRVGTASIEVPVVTIDAAGFHSTVGTATIYIPEPTVDAVGVMTLAAPVISGVALNTRNSAVTEYDSLTVNSLCVFDGYTLAATDDGIVAFTGLTDNGSDIVWSAVGAEHDFNSTSVKKILAAYVSCRLTGDVLVTLGKDQTDTREYRLAPRSEFTHVAKVRFGLGVMGNQWQWGVKSTGGYANINNITIDVESVTRRIR